MFGFQDDNQVMMGTVGWEDEEEFAFPGTADNDGHTMVRVQLFVGRDISKPLRPKQGQGYRIIAHLSGAMFRIPPRGTRVLVACPKGMEHAVGAGLIIGSFEPSPFEQFGETKGKLDLGEDVDLVIKARSVTITDYQDQQISLSEEGGVQIFDTEGAGIQFKNGKCAQSSELYYNIVHSGGTVKAVMKLSDSEATIATGDGTMVKCKAGQCTISGGQFVANATLCLLGIGATAQNFAQTTVPPGVPGPSTKVWIAP